MDYQERIQKYTAVIVSYLKEYSSKSDPKSIREIAEVLNVDNESVGAVIHELMTTGSISVEHSAHLDGYRYFIAS